MPARTLAQTRDAIAAAADAGDTRADLDANEVVDVYDLLVMLQPLDDGD